MRLRLVLVALGCIALVAIWFLSVFRPNRERLGEVREQVAATEQEIASLEAQLRRLQQLQREEPRLRAELARFGDAIPPDHRVPDFILQVQDAANLAGIDFLAITPSQPSAPAEGATQVIGVSLSVTGTFFEMEDFIFRMERLQRSVRLNSFALGGEGEMSVSLTMQMFALPRAPLELPPPAGTTPAPAASPAPTPGSA